MQKYPEAIFVDGHHGSAKIHAHHVLPPWFPSLISGEVVIGKMPEAIFC